MIDEIPIYDLDRNISFFYYSELMVELLRFGHHMNID